MSGHASGVSADEPGPSPVVDSREALVRAARQLFAENGFERTTMRAVARLARVDPALIYHYFPDGKKGLLAAALTPPAEIARQVAGLSGDPQHAGEELIRRALRLWDTDDAVREQGVALLRIGVGSETGAALLGRTARSFVLGLVGEVLAPDDRELRAALVGAQIQGLLLDRYVLGHPDLVEASAERLVASVGPVIQRYLTGPLDGPGHLAGAGGPLAVPAADPAADARS